ncbi:unnamed protein product [Thlaspi arvense]|uniref:J domain-containing protein n=1 Tax=Thlaspi arvense TaxID=13288 RepID=A0AAU9SS48_THLAR|nr:unnamed protein product [Thlaspi arvense]
MRDEIAIQGLQNERSDFQLPNQNRSTGYLPPRRFEIASCHIRRRHLWPNKSNAREVHFPAPNMRLLIASEELKHRVFEVSLADLQGDEDHTYRKIRLRAEDVQGKNGMDLTTDKPRSLKTKDSYTLRLFCTAFTKRRGTYITYSQTRQITPVNHFVVRFYINLPHEAQHEFGFFSLITLCKSTVAKMTQMDESRLKNSTARRAKATAVEKLRDGDLAGAKEFAARAKELNPSLSGLLCLNAVLDVLMGFEKKINGEIDWYAVLAVEPTADVDTIKDRYNKLSMDIITDGDKSVGGIIEAENILAETWRVLCEDAFEVIERPDASTSHVDLWSYKKKTIMRTNEVPIPGSDAISVVSPTSIEQSPQHIQLRVTGSINQLRRGSQVVMEEENEQMVQETPMRVPSYVNQLKRGSQVLSSTYTPVILSAPEPLHPPQRCSKGKEPMVQPPLRILDQDPNLIPVVLQPKPAQRLKMFDGDEERNGKISQSFGSPKKWLNLHCKLLDLIQETLVKLS